nr:MAG TPA: hypothetical protein [Caudoviricetes sp.]
MIKIITIIILAIAFIFMLVITIPLMGMGLGIGFLLFGDLLVGGYFIYLIVRRWLRKRRRYW